ncbi:hypothetical protein D9756_001241 [Leucocoprinus leucothites]|uniref:Zn(2)-C6 fungal-type domain-containing protein n=1 Tax=Leucocoprinus leucothites TaxID=201217 RepID=A0A8H5G3V7_9AGAR|nr:hypothetical protein D9756_001241 [Leucoagaricus leucothites]
MSLSTLRCRSTQLHNNYPQYSQHPQHHTAGGPGGGSDALATPPIEHNYPNFNGKRPSVLNGGGGGAGDAGAKKMRRDSMSMGNDDRDDASTVHSPSAEKEDGGSGKPKTTRGSRQLKMKCVGLEEGPPCKRCIAGNHECIFEVSNHGKRSSKKREILTRSRKMEKTLDTVLCSIGNPSIASGMISRSPSPSTKTQFTQALLGRSPSPGCTSTGPTPSTSTTAGGAAHCCTESSSAGITSAPFSPR